LLAPEAVVGFQAVGLLEWSRLLSEAMAFFPTPYPRDRVMRLSCLPSGNGRGRAQWDPFVALDDKFYESVDAQPIRWETAADSYAASVA
jgi:hypothetical protein